MSISAKELMRSDPLANQVIELAKSTIPRREFPDTVEITQRENTQSFAISLRHEKTEVPPALFIEGPAEWYLQPGKLISQENGRALFHVDLSQAPKGINYSEVKLKYTFVKNGMGIEFEK